MLEPFPSFRELSIPKQCDLSTGQYRSLPFTSAERVGHVVNNLFAKDGRRTHAADRQCSHVDETQELQLAQAAQLQLQARSQTRVAHAFQEPVKDALR